MSMFHLPGEHQYKGLKFPESISKDVLQKVETVDLSGDVVVISYPKTGTVWTKEIVWLLMSDGNTTAAKATPGRYRARFLEICFPNDIPNIEHIESQPHPRVLHSHLVPEFFGKTLPGKTKFVVVIRNPKDALVSYYHFYRSNALLGNFDGSWDEFFQLFAKKGLAYGDFFDWYLSWVPHLDKPNVLLVKYEDLKSNLENEITRISRYLGKSHSQETINKVASFVSLDSMKENDGLKNISFLSNQISPFVRKGIVGDWKNYFSKEQSDMVCRKYEETLQKCGIALKFE